VATILQSYVQFESLRKGLPAMSGVKINSLRVLALVGAIGSYASGLASKKREPEAAVETGVLWQDPGDIASRDLYYGSGGRREAPAEGKFTFFKEDLKGSNPKFDVRDAHGVKWKVKLGNEARPETVASRIVWAAGYFVTEDYFVPELHVEGMPRLHRGENLVRPGGIVYNARLKREEKKIGIWRWRADPFTGTREWNGLRVLMAVINNWDLKDGNNAIYRDGLRLVYLVSDLGASFGTDGRALPLNKDKGDLTSFRRSRFIVKTNSESISFAAPARPQWILFCSPKAYIMRVRLEWIGRDIPRDDARWMGRILSRLSRRQIGDAFRAAGYSPEDTAAFSQVLHSRIAALTGL
jgi:hypothetical protein